MTNAPVPLYSFRPRSGGVTSLKYIKLSDTDSGIISGTSSGNLSLWLLTSKRSIWTENVGSSVLSIDTCYINGVERLLSQGRSRTVNIWDHAIKKKMLSVNIKDPGFCKLTTFNQDSLQCSCFGVANPEHKINLYSLLSQKIEISYSTKASTKGMCMCVSSSYDSSTGRSYILGGFEDGSVLCWDERNTNAELNSCQLFSDPVMCMIIDDTILRGVAGSPGKTLQSFVGSFQSGLLEKDYAVELKNPGISSINVRCDKKVFATGGWDGRIRLFTWMKGKSLAIINYHSDIVNSVNFPSSYSLQRDSNLLMCGSNDETFSAWNLF